MKGNKKNTKELSFKCSCGCKAQLLLQDIDNEILMIDVREDERKKWTGVVLKEKEVKNLKRFLDSFSVSSSS